MEASTDNISTVVVDGEKCPGQSIGAEVNGVRDGAAGKVEGDHAVAVRVVEHVPDPSSMSTPSTVTTMEPRVTSP